MKTKYKLLAVALGTVLFSACQLDKDPIGLLTPEVVDTKPTFNSVNYSVKSSYQMLSSTLNILGEWSWDDGTVTRNDFVLYDIASDDAFKKWNPDGDQPWMDEVHNYSYIASNTAFNGFWSYQYEGVARANLALSYLNNDRTVEAVGLDDDLRNRLLGESHFLRAFYYFDLVTNFGDIPLITEPIENFNQAYEFSKREDKERVWELINSDLKLAKDLLPATKYSEEKEQWRVSKGAALAMQAKAALYNKEFGTVKTVIAELESYNFYSLNDNYFHAFSIEYEFDENEVIFAYDHESKKTPNAGNGLCALLGWGFFAPSSSFLKEFEPDDPRLDFTVDVDKKAPYKILGEIGIKNLGNEEAASNKIYIRYADVLLWKAEALIETGSVAQGVDVINEVRARARNTVRVDGTSKAPAGTLANRDNTVAKAQAMDWLIHERRVELGLESHRLRDLKRWGIAKEVLNKNGQAYKDYHFLAPIPQRDIDKSGGILTQNPGY